MRAAEEFAAGVDDQIGGPGPCRETRAVHSLIGADVEIVSIGGEFPLGRWWAVIEVARLAAGDGVDLAEVFGRGGGLLAPLAADQIVCGGVEEVHRDEREERRRATLEEEHIVRIAEAE